MQLEEYLGAELQDSTPPALSEACQMQTGEPAELNEYQESIGAESLLPAQGELVPPAFADFCKEAQQPSSADPLLQSSEPVLLQTPDPPVSEPPLPASKEQPAADHANAAEQQISDVPKPTRPKRTLGSKRIKPFKEYAIVFKGNDSAKWDGKEVWVDGEWLEDMYGAAELFPGRVVQLPWGDTPWKAVVSRIPGKSFNS